MTFDEIMELADYDLDKAVSKHVLEIDSDHPYSEDMNYAWEVYIHIMSQTFSIRHRFYKALQDMASTDYFTISWPDVFMVLRYDMPTAICRAALIAILSAKEGW